MNNCNIEDFKKDVNEILVKNALSEKGMGSEDDVKQMKHDLGVRFGLQVYSCEGFNEYKLDNELLMGLQVFGAVQMDYGFPKLLIEDPQNPNSEVEIPIIDPTEQL